MGIDSADGHEEKGGNEEEGGRSAHADNGRRGGRAPTAAVNRVTRGCHDGWIVEMYALLFEWLICEREGLNDYAFDCRLYMYHPHSCQSGREQEEMPAQKNK